MANKMGFAGKLYYHATLLTSSTVPSSWTIVGNAQDVTIMDSMREVDVETKGADGIEETEPSSTMGGIEFTMIYDAADAVATAFETAYRARTALAWGAMDATWATGVKGTIFNGKITKFEKSQPVKDTQKVSITVKPCLGSYFRAHTAS
jgi:hypothetical protein